jgi:hypothetical protein
MDYPNGHRGAHTIKTVSPFNTTLFKAIPADLSEMKVGDFVLTCPSQFFAEDTSVFHRTLSFWQAPQVVSILAPKSIEYYQIDAYPITKINTASIYISTETDNIKIDYKDNHFVKTKGLGFRFYIAEADFMDLITSPSMPVDFVFDEAKWNIAQRIWNKIKDNVKDKSVDDIITLLEKLL